jgi:hypothetical protein
MHEGVIKFWDAAKGYGFIKREDGGVTSKLWEMADMVDVLEAWESQRQEGDLPWNPDSCGST